MISSVISNPLFITYGLIALTVILIGWIVRLEIKIHRLLLGKSGRSLEDTILSARENLQKLNTFQREAISYFEHVEKRLSRSIQAVETIRFNPFKGTGDGGNQSFSTVFLSEEGNGVLLSTLHSRDRMSIFSKPLQKFESDFGLTEEEKEVLSNSKKTLE